MKGFARWMLWAPGPARTPDIEPPWQAASRISPPNQECWWLLSVCVCVFLLVCVWAGRWSAHPRGVVEHLLGSTSANQTSDVRRQWKIPPQTVRQAYTAIYSWYTVKSNLTLTLTLLVCLLFFSSAVDFCTKWLVLSNWPWQKGIF